MAFLNSDPGPNTRTQAHHKASPCLKRSHSARNEWQLVEKLLKPKNGSSTKNSILPALNALLFQPTNLKIKIQTEALLSLARPSVLIFVSSCFDCGKQHVFDNCLVLLARNNDLFQARRALVDSGMAWHTPFL